MELLDFGFELVLELFDRISAHLGPCLDILGPFLGHIVELDGNKRLFVTERPRHT